MIPFLKPNAPIYFCIAGIFFLAFLLAVIQDVAISSIMESYQYNVLVVIIAMELFTNLVVSTGIMQLLAIKVAFFSKGKKKHLTVFFGVLMFFISAFLNNITAVMVILPVIFVLLKALDVDKNFVCVFFAIILALSNTGGASSPIGDAPAIIIMSSGITTFVDYLIRAMPIFFITSLALVVIWLPFIKTERNERMQQIAVDLLNERHKFLIVDYKTLIPLIIIFVMMFLAWSFVPQRILPLEIVALLGYVAGAVICVMRGKEITQTIDIKALMIIAAFLFFAGIISGTGWLAVLAAWLQNSITDIRVLLLVIMFATSILSGLFSAGPAAAAMMPVIINLCNGALASYTHWVAIAYAISICAGSSLFLWSATAGFILSDKVEKAHLGPAKKNIKWNVGSYLRYGFVNYLVQLAIGMLIIYIVVQV